MQRRRIEHRGWPVDRWEIEGVIAGEHLALATHETRSGSSHRNDILDDGPGDGPGDAEVEPDDRGASRSIHTGLAIELFHDSAELYYMNLVSEHPSVFVVCRPDPDGLAQPFLVTLDPEEASSHMEVDDDVLRTPISPELYRWAEAYVLEHYVPKPRYKRRLNRDDRKRR